MPSSRTTASTASRDPPLRVIVIGAGISGLACARELQHRRYEVLVVEARARCGGRLKGESVQVVSDTVGSTARQTGIAGSSSPSNQHCVDIGGALIHGIDQNPVMRLVDQMGIRTHDVSGQCLLLDSEGNRIDNDKDAEISELFNQCLEESFQRIGVEEKEESNGAASLGPSVTELTATRTTRQACTANPDDDEASRIPSPPQQQQSFGALLQQVVHDRTANRSTTSFDPLLFQWHQANLELSCGASFGNLGYMWNDDEPYGFDGEHVAMEPSWRVAMENLREPLEILYEAQVQTIEYEQDRSQGRETPSVKRRRVATSTSAPSLSARTQYQRPSRRSRRLHGEDANLRRSSRTTKGTPAAKLSIADSTSLSYDEPLHFERHQEMNGRRRDARKKKRSSSKVRVVVQRHGKTLVLEADVVVCTLPLGILKIPPQQPGHVAFGPPLPRVKQAAIQQLGCGVLNKCVLSFPFVFWPQDTEFMGLASDPPHLILNASLVTGKPLVIFMFGGDYARQVEAKTDAEIVDMCLSALRKACRKTDAPEPIDYIVTRWGEDCFARGAFVYIPPGVDGTQQLEAMSEPIVARDGRPLVQFAGEHTTPYHPSTIHGAFLSGIREAYRLDLYTAPALNEGLQFGPENIYERTFPVKRSYARVLTPKVTSMSRSPARRRRRHEVMTLRKRKEQPMPKMNGTRPAVAAVQPAPSRRSLRQIEVEANVNRTEGGRTLSLEDRTLLRSFASYRNWPLIQSKVFPIAGRAEILSPRTAAQLRAAHQGLLRQTGANSAPETVSLAPWISKPASETDGKQVNRAY